MFSSKEAIDFSWEAVKKNALKIFILWVIVFVLLIVGNIVVEPIFKSFGTIFLLIYLVFEFIASTIITLGVTKIALDLLENKDIDFKNLYLMYSCFINYFLMSTLLFLIFTAGTLACTALILFVKSIIGMVFTDISSKLTLFLSAFIIGIPFSLAFVVFCIKVQFAQYFIIEKKYGPLQSLKASFDITHGNFWNLIVFGLLIAGVQLLGTLSLFLGLLVTVPMGLIATAHIYAQLTSQNKLS